jgi:hypothetical protein
MTALQEDNVGSGWRKLFALLISRSATTQF